MHALRGNDFFYDLYDKPELFKEVMSLITESIIHYLHLKHRLDGRPDIIPESYNVCDDLSAMIPPNLWAAFVIPFIEQYYRGLTTAQAQCPHRGSHQLNICRTWRLCNCNVMTRRCRPS